MKPCFMLQTTNNPLCPVLLPRVKLVYIYPQVLAHAYLQRAERFVATYVAHPPGMDHGTVIVCNGGPAEAAVRRLFEPLPNLQFVEHDNSGWDIGGFQKAARTVNDCGLMVFFGGSTYFKKAGWLAKMAESFSRLGSAGLYGATGSQGVEHLSIFPHVRTTAFWCAPELFNTYPRTITEGGSFGQRYEFEHGRTGLTTWWLQNRRPAYITAWTGDYPVNYCNSIPDGFHKGDQSNVLVGDRMTAPPYHHCE